MRRGHGLSAGHAAQSGALRLLPRHRELPRHRTRPRSTAIAHFVSTLGEDIARVVSAVVAICDSEGLIGREMFAIDGVKLPSNASKQRSVTRAAFERQATKLAAATTVMVQRHRAEDALPNEPDLAVKAAQRITRLERDATQLRDWLAAHPADRRGPTGGLRQSNRTDNESAKMATNKGVIQGYTGVAAVDARRQIIVEAQAHGTGSEQELLGPVVQAMHAMPSSVYRAEDFTYDAAARTRVCPAGQSLYRKGRALVINGFVAEGFRGTKRACGPCAHRAQCLRTPDTTPVRSVAFFRGRVDAAPETHAARMRARIDTPKGRAQYEQRFATVEPVFGNVRYNKGLDRFTLRGRTKVDGQ